MINVNLNIPILVQNLKIDGKSHYHVRPLFRQYPIATNRRFDGAISQFKKEVRQLFRGLTSYRYNIDELLWFKFNPEFTYQTLKVSFALGKQYINGTIGLASFKLQGLHIGILPVFNSYMFMLQSDKKSEVNIEHKTTEIVQQLMRMYKTEAGPNFDPAPFFSLKGEFTTTVSFNVNVNPGKFSYEMENEEWLFSKMGPNADFNGGDEIEKVAYELNSLYPSEMKRAFYREELVTRVHKILYQREHTPIVLIGKEGTGKHSLVHEAVYRYMEKNKEVNEVNQQKLWHLDPTRIIAGMSVVGWWQKRFEAIIHYLRNNHKNPSIKKPGPDKLLIDNVVAMLRIGKSSQNALTLSDVLKPYLEKRQLQLVLIALPEEWKIIQEKDRRFSDLFQVIRIQEASPTEAAKMVLERRKQLELRHECEFSIQAINQLFTIQRNYLKQRALPGSVVKLMDQLAVKYKYQQIDIPEVREEFKSISGLSDSIFDYSIAFEKNQVYETIALGLVGQAKAAATLSEAIHLIKARLTNPNKPLGSFLFIGPTGVGKTQAAKVLAKYLKGSEEKLIRFDMNEYIDEAAVHRLIGDYDQPEGQLTGKVRYEPFGILLLDEIEKAHPKVHDLLLQALDDGRLTDSLGRTVDFSNTIIIMTSNVGATESAQRLGFETSYTNNDDIYGKAVENFFRPEFINRIDKIVIFRALELPHILNIARLQIKELLQRDGFVRRTTILNISKEAVEWVAHRGFNAQMGGRALKRQIEKDLTALSAEQLISSYSNNPILFDIVLEEQQLVPKITELEFVEYIGEAWLPQLPEEARGKSFYHKLLRKVNKLEKAIQLMEGSREDLDELIVIGSQKGDQLDWQYYHFKELVASLKQKITNLSLGFRDRYFKDGPAIPLRLKRGSQYTKKDWTSKAQRENYKDRFFQQEGLSEIREIYNYASAQFDSMQTEFIDTFLNVSFLQIFTKDFLVGKSDQLLMRFTSCITGLGKAEIKTLMKRYVDLFDNLDIQYQVNYKKATIEVIYHGLYHLLKREAGIHLFYLAHQNPLPIKLSLSYLDRKKEIAEELKVIRIYDGHATLTDLRTGFTNAANITTAEFKLLLYAGLDQNIH